LRAGLLAAALAAGTPCLAGIEREGEGDRRATLNQMEAQPFPDAAFEALDLWAGSEPIRLADLNGRVGLIVTLDSADPSSLLIASTAQRLADEHGKNLVVIAVHPEERWDEAKLRAEAGSIRVPLARDAGKAFR